MADRDNVVLIVMTVLFLGVLTGGVAVMMYIQQSRVNFGPVPPAPPPATVTVPGGSSGPAGWDPQIVEREIETFSRIIAESPESVEAHLLRADAYWQYGDHEAALEDYGRVVELDPINVRAHQMRAHLFSAAEDYESAIAEYTALIELDPTDDSLYFQRGQARVEGNDRSGAADDYLEALELAPETPNYIYYCGWALTATGRLKSGLHHLNRHAEMHPTSAGGFVNRAYCNHRLGRVDDALADVNRAIGLGQFGARAYGMRGFINFARGELDAALADAERGLSIDAFDPYCYWLRAEIRAEQGDMDGAMADANEAIALGDDAEYSYSTRAYLRWRMGDDEAALADVARSIEIHPADPVLHKLRASYLYGLARWDEARDAIDEAMALSRLPSPEFACDRWLTLARADRQQEADAWLAAFADGYEPPDESDDEQWWIDVMSFVVGRITADELFERSEASTAARTAAQRCVAFYYIASMHLVEGDASAAARSFRQAIDERARDPYKYYCAMMELRRLQEAN